MSGWIKVHRNLLDNPIFSNEKLLKVFMWCILKATHKDRKVLINREFVELKVGEFITGRNKAGEELGMPPSTAWDYLKLLESNSTINIKSNNRFSIVSVENWEKYQSEEIETDSKSDSDTDSKSTADEQQMDTDKNVKELKNDKNKEYKDIVEYLNKKADRAYRHTTRKTQSLIEARLNEGFSLNDFKRVIDIKTNQWVNDPNMNKFLRPETLFGTKFEGYLNEREVRNNADSNRANDAGSKSKVEIDKGKFLY